jgi:serine-type D-Ala-D-Ala carboxypeptidase (penicillin-binding protein 5/6)
MATRVLSVREASKDAQNASGAGEAESGPATDGTGEVRLRAAVAAWVRPGGSEGTEDAEHAPSASEAPPGAAEAESEDSLGAGTAEEKPAAVREASSTPEAGAGSRSDAGGEAGSGDGGAGAGQDTDTDADMDSDSDSGRRPEASAGTSTDTDTGAEASDDGNAVTDPDPDIDPAPAPDTNLDDADAVHDEADAGKASAPADDAEAESGSEAGATATDGGDGTTGNGTKTDGNSPRTTGDETKATGNEAAGARAKADGDGDERAGDGTAGDSRAEARGVDQPTTVFKSLRASKGTQVDQPTTTLKAGGARKPAAPASASPVESESERTSKFVKLKSLDDPAARKPPSASAEVTSAVPRLGPERTAQQPLPPKPPLDLLAELTNTPPPPQTPVRTLVRRVKIWTPLVALLVVVLGVVQTVRPLPSPVLDLTAQQTFTFDGGKSSIPWPSAGEGALDVQGIGSFGSSGAQKPVPIASVAKVMTAYLILRDHPLKGNSDGPKILVDKTAQDQATADGQSTVQLTAGEKISEREALEAVLIASANNVARLLARWDAGSEKAFVAKMNAAAKQLGMTHTTYTDPSGLDKTTVSTAVDQVKVAKAAMQIPAFRQIAEMMQYTDSKGTVHSNWNRLVGSNGVVGIKTGTTTAAGGNLVFAALKNVGGQTETVIGAVLAQGPGGSDNTILSGALDAGDKLIQAAQGALTSATILKKGQVVGYVDDGLGSRTPVVVTKDVSAVGWAGLKVRLSLSTGNVPHSAKAGTVVGTLTVGNGASGSVKVPVALQQDLVKPGFTDKLTRLG